MVLEQYDVAIVGAGITGSTLASFLAPHTRLALLDRSVAGLRGSTGHAPGFVGQLNVLPALTELAVRSVAHYRSAHRESFADVGGLEIARTRDEVVNLAERAALAARHGLPASVVPAEEAHALAPDFVGPDAAVRALHFPDDGVADARGIAHGAQAAARAAGAALLDADVTAIARRGESFVLATSAGEIVARRVVVCTGVWAGELLPSLAAAAVSVAHPYAYSSVRPGRSSLPPFVRWPAAHVYARDHGARDGVGSYAHDPVHVAVSAMRAQASAYGAWEAPFGGVIASAAALLPPATAERFSPRNLNVPAPEAVDAAKASNGPYAFNGLFSVTPDGMPLVGPLEPGLYAAAGVWVTHAAGCAQVLADIILEDMGKAEPGKDAELRRALDPRRFEGKDADNVTAAALATYNDIYNKDQGSAVVDA